MGKDMAKSTGPTTRGGHTPKAGPKSRHGKKRGGVHIPAQGSDLMTQIARDAAEKMRVQLIQLLAPRMACPNPDTELLLGDWLRRFERKIEELPVHIKKGQRFRTALISSLDSFSDEEMPGRLRSYINRTAREGYALLLNQDTPLQRVG